MATETRPRVLYIEDDPLIADVFSRKFCGEGFGFSHASSGEIALEKLAKNPLPQVILLDIKLPGMDGFEILEKLKGDARLKDIPVIVFSNLDENEIGDRVKKLGAAFCLNKVSASLEDVMDRVRLASLPGTA